MPITGQVCFSLTRVLVPEKRKDELLDALVDAAVMETPLSSAPSEGDWAAQLRTVQRAVKAWRAQSAI